MKVAIIGAGALGLMLSNLFSMSNIDYDIFEKGKIGRKILASGNGKCNISNINFDSKYYLDNKLSYIVKDNQKELFDIFNRLHIYTKYDNEGRMYPISESSQSVLNILTKNIKNIIETEIYEIKKKDNFYYLDNYGPYDNIVIAIGSSANFNKPYPKFDILKSLNVKFNSFYPTLVGFKTNLKIKSISGVRAKALVSLMNKDNKISEYRGEIIFKDDGISGICIMNLSTYYAKIKDKSNCYIKIDLLENQDYNDLESILNPKLYKYVLDNNLNIHDFRIPISGVYDLEFAQTASGGIDIEELNQDLSLKKDKNIYAGGEILDIDAISGGYNLMFAFCCAIVIYKSIYEIYNR